MLLHKKGWSDLHSVVILILLNCVMWTTVFLTADVKNKNAGSKESIEKNHIGFACSVNCMDGRAQDAVENYMKEHYGVKYVDMITEAGPNKILAGGTDKAIIDDIQKRVEISVHHHKSNVVAIAAHDGCAGNPVSKEEQIIHLRKAKEKIESFGLNVEVIMLYVPEGWEKAELIE